MLKNGNANIKIGIESKGDPNTQLKERLFELKESGCNIIICATRTKGDTVQAVRDLYSDYRVVWLSNYSTYNADNEWLEMLNNLQAQHLLELFETIINE